MRNALPLCSICSFIYPFNEGHECLVSKSDSTYNSYPCGFYGDPVKECSCSAMAIARYQKKISGPLISISHRKLILCLGAILQHHLISSNSGRDAGTSAEAVIISICCCSIASRLSSEMPLSVINASIMLRGAKRAR